MGVPIKPRDPAGDDETNNTRVVPGPRPGTSGTQRPAQQPPRNNSTPQNNGGNGFGGGQRPAGNTGGGQRPAGNNYSGGQRPAGNTGGGQNTGGNNFSSGQRPGGSPGGGQNTGGNNFGGGQRPGGSNFSGGQRPSGGGQRSGGSNFSGGQRPSGGGGQRGGYRGGGGGQRPQQGGMRGGPNNRGAQGPAVQRGVPVRPRGPVALPSSMTIRELSEALGVGASEILKQLMKNGMMATINQQLDYDTAALMASEFDIETTESVPESMAGLIDNIDEALATEEATDLKQRPPVVTIMGHVDHGKTKLLDAIRSTRVAEGEAGGITQHIGAYQIEVHGRKITFLDTPGHEAFTAMRARGAQVTDIVVLVVAADDGVMPQTKEAIAHVKAAKVPMIVAINKVDAAGSNPDRVRQELAQADVLVEQYGGDVPSVEVSARQKTNIDGLLEIILLMADVEELKANPSKPAIGTIVEANLDKSRGPTATVLVQNGTLRLDDIVVVGGTYGKIRGMFNDAGKRLRHAEPATPVEILGLSEVPRAGDILQVLDDVTIAREVAGQRKGQRQMEQMSSQMKALSLEDLFARIQAGQVKDLNIILKADVQGSIGAIEHSLGQINTKHTEVQTKIIHTGTGAISESDVSLATASNAIIIGFNARPDPAARRLADQNGVEIRFYSIIYQLLEDLEKAMVGMLSPIEKEVVDGFAEVRTVFKLPTREVVAGLYVTDGKIMRNLQVRVLRSGVVVHDGRIDSLKRFKDDVREVQTGYECGLMVAGFNDVQTGDTMEFYHKEKVERTI
ncbi:MAG: translation initiation factor IF-2 [Herpetosiphonaceae bacterium]|nr:translation initiation factor IF-2 [Herpetosiphonaceae bacterium]